MFFKKKKEEKKFIPNQLSQILNILPLIPLFLLALMVLFGGKSEGDAIVDNVEVIQKQQITLQAPPGYTAVPGQYGYYKNIEGNVIAYGSNFKGANLTVLTGPEGFTRAGVETRVMYGHTVYMAVFTEDGGSRIAISAAYDKAGQTRFVLGMGNFNVANSAGYLLGVTMVQ